MAITPYLMFLLAGLGFGYAAPGRWKWLPLTLPLLLFLGTAFSSGVDGATLVRLVVALAVTVVGILVGTRLDHPSGEERANYA